MPLKAQSQNKQTNQKKKKAIWWFFKLGPGLEAASCPSSLLMSCKKCLAGPWCSVVIRGAPPGAGGASGLAPSRQEQEDFWQRPWRCSAAVAGSERGCRVRNQGNQGIWGGLCGRAEHPPPRPGGVGPPTTPIVGVGAPDPFPSAYLEPEGT